MKVLLVKDVYKLGRAGDIKRVADGFGRNFLIPQGLAVLASPAALKQVDRIRAQAATRREVMNNELSGLAEQIASLKLSFGTKAGETGKLYGSITTQMIADAVNRKLGTEAIDRHQIETEPIRALGDFIAKIRLTMDLIPEVKINVHREGEAPVEVQPVVAPSTAKEEVANEEVATTISDDMIAEMESEVDEVEEPLPDEPLEDKEE